MHTKAFAAAIVLSTGTALSAPDTGAQDYPDKPVKVLVGFPAGSTMDTAARILSSGLAEAFGKPVIVEVVAGAAGNIAIEKVVKATPDGYTMALAGNGQLAVNPSLYRLPYDTGRDLAPVVQVYESSNLLVVHPSVPAKNVGELVALAKAKPGELTFAHGGSGSAPHVAGELLKSMAGIDFRHIPYKGVVAAVPDLLAGRVTMTIGPTSILMSGVRDGKLRPLGVSSLTRSAALPDIPTIDESGVRGYEASLWAGVVAPAATPVEIVRKLHANAVKVLRQEAVRARFSELGMDVIANSPEAFAAIIKSDLAKWSKVVSEARIRLD